LSQRCGRAITACQKNRRKITPSASFRSHSDREKPVGRANRAEGPTVYRTLRVEVPAREPGSARGPAPRPRQERWPSDHTRQKRRLRHGTATAEAFETAKTAYTMYASLLQEIAKELGSLAGFAAKESRKHSSLRPRSDSASSVRRPARDRATIVLSVPSGNVVGGARWAVEAAWFFLTARTSARR